MADNNSTQETLLPYISPESKVISIKSHHAILSGSPYPQETDTEGMETMCD